MHPIHYSLTIAVLTLVASAVIALVLAQPLVFVIGLVFTFVFGRDTVGRFDEPEDEPPEPTEAQSIGFVKTR